MVQACHTKAKPEPGCLLALLGLHGPRAPILLPEPVPRPATLRNQYAAAVLNSMPLPLPWERERERERERDRERLTRESAHMRATEPSITPMRGTRRIHGGISVAKRYLHHIRDLI